MKHRVISFITALALCLSLCPARAAASSAVSNFTLTKDKTYYQTWVVEGTYRLVTNGYTYTAEGYTAVNVASGNTLYLTNGKVESTNGAGIVVGGSLYTEMTDVTVTGTTYGLDVASGAKVYLSGGTYKGDTAAIRVAGGNFKALLVDGCAYFSNGEPVSPDSVSKLKEVSVGTCTHSYEYTPVVPDTPPDNETPSHSGTCIACGEVTRAPCTFTFGGDGAGLCDVCGRKIAVSVTEGGLIYDGTPQSGKVAVTVTLDDGVTLTEGTHYTVEYRNDVDADEMTVIVSGETYTGTFTKTFPIGKGTPKIEWVNPADPYEVYYGDEPDLPGVTITIGERDWSAELAGAYGYFYREQVGGDSPYKEGLPTDAGTYDIIVRLPGTQNYVEAESDPITLTIHPISPFVNGAPTAAGTPLIYNGKPQALVAGGAVREGAVLQFSRTGADGSWSTAVPTETNAGDYTVYYKVEGTTNYDEVTATKIDVKIDRKPITPDVKLSYYTCVYDGGFKEPGVTVIDPEDQTVLPDSEYGVEYKDNQYVTTETYKTRVTVFNKDGGNYAIKGIEGVGEAGDEGVVVYFEITAKDQDALHITNLPGTVIYGDAFTLETTGGSGSGNVTWEIIDAKAPGEADAGEGNTSTKDLTAFATVDAGGRVTVKGIGEITVKATKSGANPGGDNYQSATATWTFTAYPKPVTAVVTAGNKIYDGKETATVTAVVATGDLAFPGDKVVIDVTGKFKDVNAGTGKEVEVTKGSITGDQAGYYDVTVPTAATADITKASTSIATDPTKASLTYTGDPQVLLSGGATASPAADAGDNSKPIQVEYALSESGPYYTDINDLKATDAGAYEVWYRVRESDNYFGTAAKKLEVKIDPKPVTVTVTLETVEYTYDGTAKEPKVEVTYTEDGTSKPVPDTEYTVAYINNVNAGDNTAVVTVTARADGNYSFTNAEGSVITETFTIKNKGAELTKAPEARDLTYTGTAQDLVLPGTAVNGHLEYAVGSSSGTYSSTIPQRTAADTYKVYYKVVGDANYTGTEPLELAVTIRPKTVSNPVIELAATTAGPYSTVYSATYNASEQEPSVKVSDGGTTIGDTEYDVSYSNNKNAGMATVHITNKADKENGNYIVNGSTTFTIEKADIDETEVTPPEGKTELSYNGTAQELIKRGSSSQGRMVYSLLENGEYSEAIPTAVAVKSDYTVYYKVLGDSNHNDTAPKSVNASIVVNEVEDPVITMSSDTFTYNGSQQKPTITVRDNQNRLIPDHEYVVEYGDGSEEMIDVGDYTLTVSAAANSNYTFTGNCERTFHIVAADQETIAITGMQDEVFYGDKIQLGITGGTGNGKVEWKVEKVTSKPADEDTPANAKTEIEGGLLTVREIDGPFVVTATRTVTDSDNANNNNYNTISTTWEFGVSRKPVTAVLTGVDKYYDENESTGKSATVTAKVKDSDTVSGDKIEIPDLQGEFEDPNVGTNKKIIIITHPEPQAITGTNADKYDISYPETATAAIRPVAATVTTPPAAKNPFYSPGEAQELVTAGVASGGTMVYSQDGVNYSQRIPTATEAGTTYTVYYKALGDSNHTDSAEEKVENITIAPRPVANPQIELLPPSAPYDGKVHRPAVIVRDDLDHVIPDTEYRVTYVAEESETDPEAGGGTTTVQKDWKSPGTYTVRITDITGGNYDIGDGEETYEITKADSNPLEIGGKPSSISLGDSFVLSATGGSGTGKIVWSSSNGEVATVEPAAADSNNGLVTIVGVGTAMITATREASENYAASTATWTFTISDDGSSSGGGNGDTNKDNGGGAEEGGDDTVVGTDKPETPPTDPEPDTPPTDPEPDTPPTGQEPETPPTDPEPEIPPTEQKPEIPPAVQEPDPTPPAPDPTPSVPDAGAGAGPNPGLDNTPPASDTGTDVPPVVTEPDTGADTQSGGSVSVQASVQDGIASAVLDAAAGDELVKEAAQSSSVVIRPEIAGDVTKAKVSIPATVVSRIGSETNAALTVSTPIADVTIPNASLGALTVDGSLNIAAEQVDNTVVLTLSANGEDVGEIPGGLTLTVPAEDAGPGTVAVLIHEDGTRETIRWSVAADGTVRIPLNGSARVEIVDNSKEFVDVPAESWASDAVAFASAHELFNGTGESTFSPEQSMSRAMLATVLYNLEGRPEQDASVKFDDVDADAWYASGVAWVSQNGITGGYGDGQFGPDDSITREQFAVMLWRYAGNPVVEKQTLSFTDAEKASGYAMEALCWAAETGVMSGYGDGQLDPGGLATRAQAAQILKNFIENM